MSRSRMSGWFARSAGLGLGLALAACGGDGGGAELDAGVPDVTAPHIVSSSPAADAFAVGVLAPLEVTFDEPIDPATVDGAVALYARFTPERVAGTVSYDEATRTLTFTPTLPLLHAERYALRVGATLTDLAGNAFAGGLVSFGTKRNSWTRRVSRAASGLQTRLESVTLDAGGRPTDLRAHNAAGADGLWGTADDVVSDRFITRWGPAGELLDEINYTFGPDGVLGNADDVVTSVTTHTWDADVREVAFTNFSGPGPDATWLTADDDISTLFTRAYEGEVPLRQIQHGHPGVDGVWRTGDDRASTIFTYTRGADEVVTRQVRTSAGPDMLPLTSDDTIVQLSDYESVGGLRTKQLFRTAGPDGVWLTSDDGYGGWIRLTRDARGLLLDEDRFTEIGLDGQWLTADDRITSRARYTYDEHGLVSSLEWYAGTVDTLMTRELYSRDAEGNVTLARMYTGPGADGVWRTLDDRLETETDYDTTR